MIGAGILSIRETFRYEVLEARRQVIRRQMVFP